MLSRAQVSQLSFLQTESEPFPTASGNACFVDIANPPVKGKHWLVTEITALNHQFPGFNSGAFPEDAVSGIYLCPPGTPPPNGENLNGAGAGLLQTQARPIRIDNQFAESTAVGTDRWTTYKDDFSKPVYVPGGWFIRAIFQNSTVNGFAGTATLTIQYVQEEDCS